MARDLLERDGGYWPRFDADVMQAALDAVVQVPRWAEWQNVRAPTLLVQGERGSMDGSEVQRMLELRPDTSHTVISDAGHDAHLDQPQTWARLLRLFLDSAQLH